MSDPTLLVLPIALAVSLAIGVALFIYYRGEGPDERAVARAREKAMLREAAGVSIFSFLVAMVWARWLGLTRHDRRLMYLLWLILLVVLVPLVVLEISSSGLSAQSVVSMPALALVVVAVSTIALMFRLPR